MRFISVLASNLSNTVLHRCTDILKQLPPDGNSCCEKAPSTAELVFQEDRDCELITRRRSEAFSKADGGLRVGEKRFREVEKGCKESGRKLRRGWRGGGR